MMFFYRYYEGHGREALVETLASADPFDLRPAEIVERVLGFGNVPEIDRPSSTPWSTVGRMFEVSLEEQNFLVAVSRDAEAITVQEMRVDAYDPIE